MTETSWSLIHPDTLLSSPVYVATALTPPNRKSAYTRNKKQHFIFTMDGVNCIGLYENICKKDVDKGKTILIKIVDVYNHLSNSQYIVTDA